ncbi:DNA methyltransferase [Candidatus Kaistella beijingensis]|uniref:DNA methyltransferase n=1 Tax=Candidatus Kaistella beijingensis TaxID=2820270 RepID=UPI001CC5B3F7|nr:DNA methyltransferase [Candidatus Kaistella beijingensis]
MQVKSRKRVADHGEVFTNEREVKAMLDLVKDQTERIDATFLEPACGSGNFLIEILHRKLQVLLSKYKNSRTEFDKNLIVAVYSIYGVELLEDNAAECRERLYTKIEADYPKKFKTHEDFTHLMKSVQHILHTNIICGNALDYTTKDGDPIIFTHWSLQTDGKVIQNFFDYREISNVKQGMQSLFAEQQDPNPPKPKHYLKLYRDDEDGI